jgi:hypothetical protein
VDKMNEDARRLVQRARDERTPSELDKARVRKAVALGLAAAATGVSGAATGAAVAKVVGATGLGTGLKVLASVVVVAVLGAGTYVWTQARMQAPEPAVPVAAPPPRIEGVPVAAPAPLTVEETPVRAAAHARPARPTPDPLVAELALLHRAQQAWHDGQAAAALDLARRHAQLYPRSQLALERGALQVFALCALGRKSEARGLASGLLAQAPRSPLRTSLEESCAAR